MRNAKETQRPGQGRQKINQRQWIKSHRVPLRQERQAAGAQRIPCRQFSTPEAVTMIFGQRVAKAAVVAIEKCLPAKQYARKQRADQQREKQSESGYGEPARFALRCRASINTWPKFRVGERPGG